MTTFSLAGDITHAGHVRVTADTVEDAIEKAEAGLFDEVLDEDHKNLGFVFCGDDEGGVETIDGSAAS